ncbi:MAG: hypothetical protein WBB82_00755 [Limnothrix sp.]
MKKHWLLFTGSVSLVLISCSPEITEPSPNTETTPPPVTESTAGEISKTSEPIVKTSPRNKTEILEPEWIHYSNDDWFITVVEDANNPEQNSTYYGCNAGRQDCLKLESGVVDCAGDVCTHTWVNGEYSYVLTVSEFSRTLTVTQGDEVQLESGELNWSAPQWYSAESDIIDDGREEVAGITEQELLTLLPQIQRAVFLKDWETLAELSADFVSFNLPDEVDGSDLANNEIVAALSEQNLDDWESRVMTQTMADLFFNQYGVMLGQGSIWLGESNNNQEPKIITFNIW